jgi:hypothetical protein
MTGLPDAFCCKERNPVFIFSQSGSIFFLLPALQRFSDFEKVTQSVTHKNVNNYNQWEFLG